MAITINVNAQLMPAIYPDNTEDKIRELRQNYFRTKHDLLLKRLDVGNEADTSEVRNDFEELLERIAEKLRKVTFTVKNETEAEVFFGQGGLSTLQNSTITGLSADRGTATVELLSDIWGPGRIAFGGTIVNVNEPNDSIRTQQEILENYFASGGNVYMAWAVPVLVIQQTPKEGENSRFKLVTYFYPKVGGILPTLGTEAEQVSANFDPGFELHLQASSRNQNFSVFVDARLSYTIGTNQFSESISTDKNRFPFGFLIGGFTLSKLFTVYGKGTFLKPDEFSVPFRIGVSMTPDRD